MKRRPVPREALATHEAGHLVAISSTRGLALGEFVWHRLTSYEIAHVEPLRSTELDWETPDDRNTLIARHAAVALAGGAAELVATGPEEPSRLDIRAIHELVGGTDFELAHEWLTLQRYDPDQETLERDLQRLFHEVRDLLDEPRTRAAVAVVRGRILELLRGADAEGAATRRTSGAGLVAGVAIDRTADFLLRATLRDRIAAPSP